MHVPPCAAATPLPCRGGVGVGSVLSLYRLVSTQVSSDGEVLAMQAAKPSPDPTPAPPLEGRGVPCGMPAKRYIMSLRNLNMVIFLLSQKRSTRSLRTECLLVADGANARCGWTACSLRTERMLVADGANARCALTKRPTPTLHSFPPWEHIIPSMGTNHSQRGNDTSVAIGAVLCPLRAFRREKCVCLLFIAFYPRSNTIFS
jgi:hypothetical protein